MLGKLTKGRQNFVSNARFIEIEILNTQMKWKDKRQLGFCDEFIYDEERDIPVRWQQLIIRFSSKKQTNGARKTKIENNSERL